jgi:hypothetical protein
MIANRDLAGVRNVGRVDRLKRAPAARRRDELRNDHNITPPRQPADLRRDHIVDRAQPVGLL